MCKFKIETNQVFDIPLVINVFISLINLKKHRLKKATENLK